MEVEKIFTKMAFIKNYKKNDFTYNYNNFVNKKINMKTFLSKIEKR